MKFLKCILLIALLYFNPHFTFSQTGVVKGRVYNAKNNEPLPFVNVVLWNQTDKGAVSDINGNYRLEGVPLGYVKLIASFVGYERKVTEEVMVTRVHEMVIDIGMEEGVILLQKVEIKASPFMRKDDSPVSIQNLGIAEIEKNPGSNRDISRVIQSLPGVASSPAYRNDIIVRGGGPSENRFYLDGIEIPNINHFATQGASGGPAGIINADFIREVEFLAGAFPASRGNALSSVIEFRQIDGNRDKVNFHAALGAIDLGLTAEGPVNEKSTFLFSLRRSYLKFLFNIIGLPFLPTYNDYQFKYKWNINKNNQFTLSSLGSLDNSKLNTGLKNPSESQRYILGYLPYLEQWSYTIGGVYRHFRKNGSDVIVLSRNMLDNRSYKYKDNKEVSGNKILDYNSREIENKFRYERKMEKSRLKTLMGASLEYAKYSNETFRKLFLGNMSAVLNYKTDLDLWKYGAFAQASHSWFNERLGLSLGLRADGSSYSGATSNPLNQLSPRFTASYLLRERFYLNINMGRYFQLPPYTTMGFKNNDGLLINKAHGLKYLTADHYVVGLEYLPGENQKITLEGFYKIYDNYPFSVNDSVSLASKGGADYGTYGDEEVTSTSEGRTYGLELLWRNNSLKGFNILASYTLVRSEFKDVHDKYIPSSWDNIHIFNFTLTKVLKKNWNIGMKWRYLGGEPYTPYDMEKSGLVSAWDVRGRAYLDYSKYNSLRLDGFHQLDLRVDKEYFFDKWTLMLYLDIQNAYNFQADQQSYLVNYDKDGVPVIYDDNGLKRYVLREIPNTAGTFLPSIGIMVEF